MWQEINNEKLKKGDIVRFNYIYKDGYDNSIGIVKSVEIETLITYNEWVYVIMITPEFKDYVVLKDPYIEIYRSD